MALPLLPASIANKETHGRSKNESDRAFGTKMPSLNAAILSADGAGSRRIRPSLEKRHKQLSSIAESPAHFISASNGGGIKSKSRLPSINEQQLARAGSVSSLDSWSSGMTTPRKGGGGSTRSSRKGSRRGSSMHSSMHSVNSTKLKGLLNRLRPLKERTQGEPFRRFRKFARGVSCFVGLLKFHMNRSIKWTQQYLNSDVLNAIKGNKDDLLFDVNFFRSSKQSRIPRDAVRILQSPVATRTEQDIHYLMVMQRAYPALAEYPLFMQKMIAERGYYQSYGEKKILTREGQPAVAFYYILSGSAMVTKYDHHANVNKPVGTLERGSLFGEESITKSGIREFSVLSKEPVELLSLFDSDFLDIFMSRGQTSINEAFLRSLGYMKNWPVEILSDHPKKVIFTYFKRRFLITLDSNASEWMYIVKSGSLSVLKKLKSCTAPETSSRTQLELSGHKPAAKDLDDHRKVISLNRQLHLVHARMDADKVRSLPYYTPEINVALNNVLQQIAATPANRVKARGTNIGLQQETASTEEPTGIDHVDTENFLQGENELQEAEGLTAAISGDSEVQQANDIFVAIQVLSRGSVFGLIQGYASNISHPSFSLVSNGAECVMIQKKFYLDNAPEQLLHKLREEIFPYPSDVALQDMLCTSLSWAKYRKIVMKDELQHVHNPGFMVSTTN